MTKKKSLTVEQIAAAMNLKKGSAVSRLIALGYFEHCGRCGGGGLYSFNQTHGSMCYGCQGAGKKLAVITQDDITQALARIARGELDGYLAELQAKRTLEAAHKLFWKTYMATAIGAAYNEASKALSDSKELACKPGETNDDYTVRSSEVYARFDTLPAVIAQRLQNKIVEAEQNAHYDRKSSFKQRVDTINACTKMVISLNTAWSQI